MLIVFAGLPGTGKSSLARRLSAQLSVVILDKDPIRAALFPSDEIEYSTRQDDFCMGIILQVVGYLFEKNPQRMVILDGRPYSKRYQVQQVVDFCTERTIELRLIECVCSPETAMERLSRAARHLAANRGPALYNELRAGAEPIDLPHLVVDTDQPIDTCLQQCRVFLMK